jgi:predicted dehydrogenase
MNIAVVGCGFVADSYLSTLTSYPELKLLGLTDLDHSRSALLAQRHPTRIYPTLTDLLSDPAVDLVLNLTNPSSHYDVSRAALLAGKHVYSEKPLAMQMDQARELAALAASRGLSLASAPCSLLGETAQTIGKILRGGSMGQVRVVYAEMEDGMIHRAPYQKWRAASGLPWPYRDEFEVGCTIEHAAYCVTWLASWFGPATSVTSFASIQIPGKLPSEPLAIDSPDFSVACIQFASGVVARLTCGIVAPHDHTMKIVTDNGILYTPEVWSYSTPVFSRRLIKGRSRILLSPLRKKHRLARGPHTRSKYKGEGNMDYARGPAELAAAIRERRPSRLSNDFCLHVNEITLAIHWSREQGAVYRMTTTFDPIEPTPWA